MILVSVLVRAVRIHNLCLNYTLFGNAHLIPSKYSLRDNITTKQDRQCTYNVTFWRVRATIVAVEKQSVFHNLCMRL